MRLSSTHNLPWNGLGGALSFLCLIHCLGLPWLAVLLPVTPLLDESTHLYLFLLLAPIAIFAAWQGLRRHGICKSAFLLCLGLVLVGVAVFMPLSESREIVVTLAGSLLLISGHILNSRLAQSYRTANPS